MVAVQQVALVSDESAIEACSQKCAIQTDDLYLYLLPLVILSEQKRFQLKPDYHRMYAGTEWEMDKPLLLDVSPPDVSFSVEETSGVKASGGDQQGAMCHTPLTSV